MRATDRGSPARASQARELVRKNRARALGWGEGAAFRSPGGARSYPRRLAVGIRISVGIGAGGAPAAFFVEASEIILKLGALLGSEHLANLVAPLVANLRALRI